MEPKEVNKNLSEQAKKVLFEKGTEAPFSGEYVDTDEQGMYTCANCGNPLFSSETKFHSGTGWPSFDQALPGAVEFHEDVTHGMHRTEVVCAKCGAHLGHVFNDGPAETTGKRFCINSVCLDLEKNQSAGENK